MHERLISLRQLALEGRNIPFAQAFLAWRRIGHLVTWNGSVRLASEARLLTIAAEETSLAATSLDGRSIVGQVVVTAHGGLEKPLSFTGSGPLVIEGREL